ncbi:hypothetical protein [Leminorella grimontii]|uniref:hypothetical protein n=1 Tax=Leminorella grimontii TaxID=82981 RepID=UPI003220049D
MAKETTPTADTSATTAEGTTATVTTPATTAEGATTTEAPKKPTEPVYLVRAVGLPRRMRGGMMFSAEGERVRKSQFSKAQWKAINDDDHLKVKVVDDNAADDQEQDDE